MKLSEQSKLRLIVELSKDGLLKNDKERKEFYKKVITIEEYVDKLIELKTREMLETGEI